MESTSYFKEWAFDLGSSFTNDLETKSKEEVKSESGLKRGLKENGINYFKE